MSNPVTPSASFTKVGNMLIVFAIALLAIYIANNYAQIGSLVQKKAA